MSADAQTLHAETFAELSDIINRDHDSIVEQWLRQVAEERPRGDGSHRQAMRDQLPAFLRALALGLRRTDSAERGPHRLSALEHGEQRWTIGWRLADLVRDYQILRLVLVEHLSVALVRPLSVREVMAIGLLLDEAIAAAVVMFVAHEERRLSETERQLRDIMDAVPDGIMAVNPDGSIRLANPAAGHMFGCEPDNLSGQQFPVLFDAAEVEAAEPRWWWPQAHERAAPPPRRQIQGRRSDGSRFALELAVCRFERDDDPLTIALLRDITEQQRVAEKLKRYAIDLENLNRSLARLTGESAAANQAKSEFLANMSHDIRSPLTAVLGYVELLAMQLREPEQVHAIETIKRNTHFLVDILNDVLDLAKIEAGKFDVERAPVSPSAIVAEIVELLSLRAAEKGLGLTMHLGRPLPEPIISDAKRLKQILINLAVNAIKFTDRGEVRITVARRPASNELAFSVSDTGVGMTAADLAQVFEPFSQVTGAGVKQRGGTGLGLTISKHLAELLGGRIQAESCAGEGSTFRLFLPISVPDGTAAPPNSSPPAPQIAALPGACRVLIADDRGDHRTVVAEFLTGLGATVVGVENGRLAVAAVVQAEQKGAPYDIVLMDMRMAELDGYQATALIRAAGIKVPIIALTASVMPGDEDECRAAGCDDFLAKPIDFSLLAECVARYARRNAPP